MKMRIHFQALLFLFSAYTGFSQSANQHKEMTKPIETPFSTIVVNGPFRFEISRDDRAAVELSGSADIVDRILVNSDGGILSIGCNEALPNEKDPVMVKIHYNGLKQLIVTSAVNVNLTFADTTTDLVLITNQMTFPGNFNVQCKSLTATFKGYGGATVTGKAATAIIDNNMYGSLNMAAFSASSLFFKNYSIDKAIVSSAKNNTLIDNYSSGTVYYVGDKKGFFKANGNAQPYMQ
jgi:hypothetical protein